MRTKEETKQLRKEIRQRGNPYKVGDILDHSWGYDQTNIDFYQVVEVKKASVVLRPIRTQTVEGSQGFMSCTVMPVKDGFIANCTQALTDNGNREITPENPSISKLVQFYIQENGEPRYYIPTPYGWCDLWKGKPEYNSWYA